MPVYKIREVYQYHQGNRIKSLIMLGFAIAQPNLHFLNWTIIRIEYFYHAIALPYHFQKAIPNSFLSYLSHKKKNNYIPFTYPKIPAIGLRII
jgi:hypothetical protein